MANEWFTQLMGEVVGPLSDQDLHDMVRKHQLTPDDEVRRGQFGRWVPAGKVRGLFQHAAAPSAAAVAPNPSLVRNNISASIQATQASVHPSPEFVEVTDSHLHLFACPDCGRNISKNAQLCPNCGHAFFRPNRGVAIALAMLLGSFGAHKFYLRKPGQAVLYLLFFWTYIPGIIGFVEGLQYLFMDDERFAAAFGAQRGEKAVHHVGIQPSTQIGAVTRPSKSQSFALTHWILGGVVAFFVLGLLGNAVLNHGTIRRPSINRTEHGPSLRRDTPAAVNQQVYDRMKDLAFAKDYAGLERLMALGLSFQLPKDTQIRVIDLGFITTEIKVESGEYVGRYMIVGTENINR